MLILNLSQGWVGPLVNCGSKLQPPFHVFLLHLKAEI